MKLCTFPRRFEPEEIRQSLPLTELMHRLGLGEHAKKTAFCPFHDNRNTGAFSVYQKEGRWRWNCFAGCGSGDEIAFLQKLEGLDFKEAMKRWAELAGLSSPLEGLSQPRRFAPKPTPVPSTPKAVELPWDFRAGSKAEIQAVASLRKVDFRAVANMSHLGVLGFGTVCGFQCWIVTDASRRVAEARRMDGLPFPGGGKSGGRKVHTLLGSTKAWPVGLCLPQDLHKGFRRVLLLEGSGDFVAGYHFCLKLQSGEKGRFLPVAMLGAGTRISPEAIPFLLGKELKIIPHEDEGGAGLKAEEGWRETLERAGLRGGTVTGLGRLRCKDGRVVKDLNDCTEICLEDKPELEGLLK